MVPFTVVISVYKNDNAESFDRALFSITEQQTLPPNEIVLVVDGPITTELDTVIAKYTRKLGKALRVLRCECNEGLGAARRHSVSEASFKYIAVMDSDDISVPDRFEKQISYMEEHPECDVLGGQITEFIDTEDNAVGKRVVPCAHKEILELLKSRCPLNHVSIIALRERILSVGNYKPWHYNEDYYLWIRMAEAGCRFANLPDTLVNVRVGKEMYRRRGGWRYFKSEKGLQDYMLKHKIISLPRYLYNVAGRFAVQVAMPNRLRGFIFQKLFRK